MTVMLPTAVSPVLDTLIHQIEAVVAHEHDQALVAAQVAEVLRPLLGNAELLHPEQCEPDPTCYRQHVVYVDAAGRFSIVALVWLAGQTTPIHDHVSWCVFGVHQGAEHEVQYQLVEDPAGNYLLPVGECRNPVGSVAALTPPGDIHHVVNPGPGCAISLHIYGADIGARGTSVRRRYDLPVRA